VKIRKKSVVRHEVASELVLLNEIEDKLHKNSSVDWVSSKKPRLSQINARLKSIFNL
jgi:hypothetical protein